MRNNDREVEPLGWNAIDGALKPIYGETEPMHWGTVIPAFLGGKDPLQGISAYRRDVPQPHLHYITYGFSDLYEKESDDPDVSRFGFELTFRIAAGPSDEPPTWVLSFLQNLARYVFKTGNVFSAGHSMPLNGPIALGEETKIWAIGFARDPELAPIDTPNGSVEFVQIVGLTLDELSAIEAWNCGRFLELLQEHNELLLTDLQRDSSLTETSFAENVRQRTEAEGSSSAMLFCNHARVEQQPAGSVTLFLGATVADTLGRRLRGRIPYGRSFSLINSDFEIRFESGDRFGHRTIEDGHVIVLTEGQSLDLCEILQPRAGTHVLPRLPELVVVIEQSEIKDAEGKVVKVVG